MPKLQTETVDQTPATETEVVITEPAAVPGVKAKKAKKAAVKPPKVAKKAVEKPAKAEKGADAKAPKPAKKAPPAEAAPAAKPLAKLAKGSTRARLYSCLMHFEDSKKFLMGMSAAEIKGATGMLPNSGHLGVLLAEGVAEGRLSKTTRDDGGKGVTVFKLTKAGKKWAEAGEFDQSALGGNRIGQLWTDPRRTAEDGK